MRTGRIKTSAADKLINERNLLKKKHDDTKTSKDEDARLVALDKDISDILAEEGKSKAYKFKKILFSKWIS